jgi:hypothetical protein
MLNLKIRYSLLFLLFFSVYFIFPALVGKFWQYGFMSIKNLYYNEYILLLELSPFNETFWRYDLFSIVVLVIFFIFFFLRDTIYVKLNEKCNDYSAALYLLCFMLPFFLLDYYEVIKYYLEVDTPLRAEMYDKFLSGRRTHVNIILILAVSLFKEKKLISVIVYLLLLTYDYLTQSRIEMLFLLLMHFLVNIELNKKYFKSILFLSITCIFIIFYRAYFNSSNIGNSFIDPLHLKISSSRLHEWLNYEVINLPIYLIDNIKFFINSFLYQNLELIDYFGPRVDSKSSVLVYLYTSVDVRTFSVRGIDTLILYPISLVVYLATLRIIIKKFKINKYLYLSMNSYLLCLLFRGNFANNLNFIIKLYLLMFIVTWIKNIIEIKLKNSKLFIN